MPRRRRPGRTLCMAITLLPCGGESYLEAAITPASAYRYDVEAVQDRWKEADWFGGKVVGVRALRRAEPPAVPDGPLQPVEDQAVGDDADGDKDGHHGEDHAHIAQVAPAHQRLAQAEPAV